MLVCQARAVADDRLAIGRFTDPVAAHLLRDAERVAVDRARSGTTPDSWRERLEAAVLNAATTVLVSRTVVIDYAVRAKANPQLVILGAGLDERAYRLPELAEVDVYEVDHPASQQDKRDRINDLRPVAKSLTHVSDDQDLTLGRSTTGDVSTTVPRGSRGDRRQANDSIAADPDTGRCAVGTGAHHAYAMPAPR